MRADMLTAVLAELNGTSADIDASAVISTDGLMVAALLPAGMDEDRVGAMSAATLVTPQSLLNALGCLQQAVSTPRRRGKDSGVPGNLPDERHPDLPAATENQRSELVLRIGDPLLPGPVRSATAALDEAIEDGGFCGESDDINLNDFKDWRKIYFNPDGYFRDACRQAMRMALQSGQIQSLTLGGFVFPVVFLPEQGGASRYPCFRQQIALLLCHWRASSWPLID